MAGRRDFLRIATRNFAVNPPLIFQMIPRNAVNSSPSFFTLSRTTFPPSPSLHASTLFPMLAWTPSRTYLSASISPPTLGFSLSKRPFSTSARLVSNQEQLELNKNEKESNVPLEVALKEVLDKLGFAGEALETIELKDLSLKAKLISYLMLRSKVQFTAVGLSAINTAADILTKRHLNHVEPPVLNPVADWFMASIRDGKFPTNLRFVPYNRTNRKLLREMY